MTATLNGPEQGQLVQVCSRQWVVNEVKPSSLPAVALTSKFASPQNLLMLSLVEDDGLGEELQVVWEIEPGARVIEKIALPEPTGFDAPDNTQRFATEFVLKTLKKTALLQPRRLSRHVGASRGITPFGQEEGDFQAVDERASVGVRWHGRRVRRRLRVR